MNTNNKLPFNNKTEYLAWRAEWRSSYKALTTIIRENKKIRSETKDTAERSAAQSHLHRLRLQASAAIEARKQSKIQAEQLYQTEQAKLATA